MMPLPITAASSRAVPTNSAVIRRTGSACISAGADALERRAQLGIARGVERQLRELQQPVAERLARQFEGTATILVAPRRAARIRIAPVHLDRTARPVWAAFLRRLVA